MNEESNKLDIKKLIINLITSIGSLAVGVILILENDLWGVIFIISAFFTMLYTIKSKKKEDDK